jgi:hypothetical protein
LGTAEARVWSSGRVSRLAEQWKGTQAMRWSSKLRRGVFSTLVMLLLAGLFSAAQPAVTQAASLKINKFYPTSKKGYDKWMSNHNNLPSPLKAFASGTKDVGYFLDYSGAKPKVSKFQIIIYDSSGNVFVTGNVHKLSYKNGYFVNYFYYTPQFPDGTYKMKLLVNGKADGSKSFSVGS